jgi:hypothetical protein
LDRENAAYVEGSGTFEGTKVGLFARLKLASAGGIIAAVE